ncbi:MAG: hypothetical protein RSC44_00250 [Clostridia bacterium]
MPAFLKRNRKPQTTNGITGRGKRQAVNGITGCGKRQAVNG